MPRTSAELLRPCLRAESVGVGAASRTSYGCRVQPRPRGPWKQRNAVGCRSVSSRPSTNLEPKGPEVCHKRQDGAVAACPRGQDSDTRGTPDPLTEPPHTMSQRRRQLLFPATRARPPLSSLTWSQRRSPAALWRLSQSTAARRCCGECTRLVPGLRAESMGREGRGSGGPARGAAPQQKRNALAPSSAHRCCVPLCSPHPPQESQKFVLAVEGASWLACAARGSWMPNACRPQASHGLAVPGDARCTHAQKQRRCLVVSRG